MLRHPGLSVSLRVCSITVAIAALSLSGCGGSSSSSVNVSGFVGIYSGTFTRAADNSTVLISADSTGKLTVVVDDILGSSNPWTGTGQINSDGTFAASSIQSRAPISMSGRFSGTGSSATFTATMSGGSSATVSGGHFVGYGGAAGNYSFSALGGPNPGFGHTTGTITFASGGKLTITGTNSGGDFWEVNGSMTELGIVTTTGTYQFGSNQGSMTCNCNGTFRFSDLNSGIATIAVIPTPSGATTTYDITFNRPTP